MCFFYTFETIKTLHICLFWRNLSALLMHKWNLCYSPLTSKCFAQYLAYKHCSIGKCILDKCVYKTNTWNMNRLCRVYRELVREYRPGKGNKKFHSNLYNLTFLPHLSNSLNLFYTPGSKNQDSLSICWHWSTISASLLHVKKWRIALWSLNNKLILYYN